MFLPSVQGSLELLMAHGAVGHYFMVTATCYTLGSTNIAVLSCSHAADNHEDITNKFHGGKNAEAKNCTNQRYHQEIIR